jgi:hypothetical protein
VAASGESRRALRLVVDIRATVESIGQSQLELAPSLQRIYVRVLAADARRGQLLPGILCDLSTNGAFVACEPLQLLSRVALRFELADLPVEAIGWVLWRRIEDCEISRERDTALRLPRGCGVLFEAIPLEARLLIHDMVSRAPRVPG